MINFNSIVVVFVGLSLLLGTIHQQETEKRKLKRVRKPDIPDKSDIYFDDIFSQALVGDRPKPTAINSESVASAQAPDSTTNVDSSRVWSKIVSREAIEDEIKSLNLQLQRSVTSPSAFNSNSQTVRQQFSLLSMLFGIIGEYDQEIRWKKFARSAQLNFAEAAKQARNPSRQSFEVARNRKDDLTGLVRGGGIDVVESAEKLNWPEVVGRRPMMVRLETALRDSLKGMVANADEFGKNKDKILQEANMIAAMSRVLVQEKMEAADDDGYVEYSESMGSAARQLIFAAQSGEYDEAAAAINKLEQSCDDCHGEWR